MSYLDTSIGYAVRPGIDEARNPHFEVARRRGYRPRGRDHPLPRRMRTTKTNTATNEDEGHCERHPGRDPAAYLVAPPPQIHCPANLSGSSGPR